MDRVFALHDVEDYLVLAINFRLRDDKWALLRAERPISNGESAWKVIPVLPKPS